MVEAAGAVVLNEEAWKRYGKHLPKLMKKPEISRALMQAALLVVRWAKIAVPKDTRRLQMSITAALFQDQEKDFFAVIGTNVEYAAYQEFGTRYMRAQPYLIPSIEQLKKSGRGTFLLMKGVEAAWNKHVKGRA